MSEPVYLPEPEPTDPAGSGFNLNEYVQLLLRRWPMIAVVAALGLAVGAVHFYLTPPMYRAETTVQIERTIFGVTSNQNPWIEAWAGIKYYPTQYRLLESRGLAERVVVELGLADEPEFNPTAAQTSGGRTVADEHLLASLASKIQAAWRSTRSHPPNWFG